MAAQIERMELEHAAAAAAAAAAQVVAAAAAAPPPPPALAQQQQQQQQQQQAATAAAAAAEQARPAAAGGAWTANRGGKVSDGGTKFTHSGSSNGWIASATEPLPGRGSASATTTGERSCLSFGLALADTDLTRGGNIFDQRGTWCINAYNGRIYVHGKWQTNTGPIAEHATVRVDWDEEGLRFFVNGEPRGDKIAWGGEAPALVRVATSLYYSDSSITLL